jgi:branched-chain amino acid transport system substrate-binding protein
MKSNLSKLAALILALVMVFSLAACGSTSSSDTTSNTDATDSTASTDATTTTDTDTTDAVAATDGEIVVGGIFNVTGDQSSIDAPAQQGFALAVELINAAGGINGRTIKYVTYDGQTDQTVCANNATKLIQTDGAIVIGGLSDSDYAYAAGAVAQTAGVPIVFSGATTPDIPSVVGDCAFLTAFGDNVCAYAAASYAVEGLNAKTAYVLVDNSMSYTTNLADYFIEKFEELGGTIVLQDYFSSGDLDFSTQAQRYLATGEADIMFMATGPDDASTVIQQFRSAGATAPMISGDGWDADLWGVAGDLANQDIYVATHYSAEDTSATVQDFIAAYNDKYGTDPENAFAALGYDCMNVIAKAIEMCGDDVTAANIRNNLEQIDGMQCVTGTITYTADSHVPDKSVVITKAVDNTLTFVANQEG